MTGMDFLVAAGYAMLQQVFGGYLIDISFTLNCYVLFTGRQHSLLCRALY